MELKLIEENDDYTLSTKTSATYGRIRVCVLQMHLNYIFTSVIGYSYSMLYIILCRYPHNCII